VDSGFVQRLAHTSLVHWPTIDIGTPPECCGDGAAVVLAVPVARVFVGATGNTLGLEVTYSVAVGDDETFKAELLA
jgi:hypothetical protein